MTRPPAAAGLAETSPSRVAPRPGAAWLVLLFLLHALPFATRPALVGGDEVHYALVAHSIATDGDADPRDDYDEVAGGSNAAGRKRAGQVLDRHLRAVEGVEIPTHPVGLPLLLAPLVRAQEWIAPGSAPDGPLVATTLALTFAALVAAWRALAAHLADAWRAAAWVFGGYFSSPLWFYSRTLFTEPYTWSFAVLGLVALVRGRLVAASALLGLTLLTKETALVVVVAMLVGAHVALPVRRAALLWIGPAAAAAVYAGRNLALGLPLATTSQAFGVGDPLAGAIGLLVDPRHGLLPFAPFVALGAAFGWARLRATAAAPAPRTAAALARAAFAGYFLVSAAWSDWRGGACYGPRLLVPVLPALLLAAALAPPAGRVVRGLLAAAFVAGFTVSWCAALRPWRAFWGASVFELATDRPLATAAGAALAIGALVLWRRRVGEPLA